MTQPSDSEVVRVLAAADGWSPCNCGNVNCYYHRVHGNKFLDDIGYLHSIDALRPVLAKLTPEEWRWLVERIALMYEASGEHGLMRYTLTLDPSVLARAVAEAVLACRKEAL